uniref:Uncharacterized protein n=1 Tax=Rhipicephalus zambeziensis TaxID=60191 RepID=A0A224YBB3_9ACAR
MTAYYFVTLIQVTIRCNSIYRLVIVNVVRVEVRLESSEDGKLLIKMETSNTSRRHVVKSVVIVLFDTSRNTCKKGFITLSSVPIGCSSDAKSWIYRKTTIVASKPSAVS